MSKENINFEETMKQLELIAEKLEKGDLTLDESVEMFEKGMDLSKKCNEVLEKAEKKISILINKDGNLSEENFIQNEE